MNSTLHGGFGRSHPSRGAWIEIDAVEYAIGDTVVAPLTGCVD